MKNTDIIAERKYFIVEYGKRKGPYTIDEVKLMSIERSTLVWCEGMTDWTQADDILEFNEILKDVPPPIPQQNGDLPLVNNPIDIILHKPTSHEHKVILKRVSDAVLKMILGGEKKKNTRKKFYEKIDIPYVLPDVFNYLQETLGLYELPYIEDEYLVLSNDTHKVKFLLYGKKHQRIEVFIQNKGTSNKLRWEFKLDDTSSYMIREIKWYIDRVK